MKCLRTCVLSVCAQEYLYGKETSSLTYHDFVNKELVLFSNSDNERSIPCLVDGKSHVYPAIEMFGNTFPVQLLATNVSLCLDGLRKMYHYIDKICFSNQGRYIFILKANHKYTRLIYC